MDTFPKYKPMDKEYIKYVNSGGSCKDYPYVKTGGWKFDGKGCENGACGNQAATAYGVESRTDVEGMYACMHVCLYVCLYVLYALNS